MLLKQRRLAPTGVHFLRTVQRPSLPATPALQRARGAATAGAFLALAALAVLLPGSAAQAQMRDWEKVTPEQAAEANARASAEQARASDRHDDAIAQQRRPRPLWEAGLGLSLVDFPDYRGSARRSTYPIPIPYFVYRGPVLRIDRGGLKAELLDNGRMELNLSLNASVPVRSRSDSVRAGMPSLRPTLEVGPQLQADLWRSQRGDRLLQFQLPVRYALALGPLSRANTGFIANPRIVFDTRGVFGFKGLNAAFIAGPLFATARQHAYFYSVDPQYATAQRPAYEARGGYSGFQATLGFSRRWRSVWVGGFLRVDDLHGARFQDSPLVQKRVTYATGLAFTWIFAESSDLVVRKD